MGGGRDVGAAGGGTLGWSEGARAVRLAGGLVAALVLFSRALASGPPCRPQLFFYLCAVCLAAAGDCFPLSDPRCYAQMHQPFFFSWNTVNVTVRGAGTVADGSPTDGVIDGHGSEWWGCAGSCPHVPYCAGGQKIGTPGSKTCPLCPKAAHPCNGVSRPHLIMMANVMRKALLLGWLAVASIS